MEDEPGERNGHGESNGDVADEVDVEHTDDEACSGPVNLPDSNLLGAAADNKGHEDNQAEVRDNQAEESKYQHEVTGIELVAVQRPVYAAKRHEVALAVGKNLRPRRAEGLHGPVRIRCVYTHHQAELEKVAVQQV